MGDVVSIQTGQSVYNLGKPVSGPITTGGGDGGGGMDLEERVYNAERDLTQIRSDLGKITGTLPHLATKAWVSSASGLLALVVIAMGLLNFFFSASGG